MVQTAMGSDRQVWANYLGRIIFSMNEIDWLLGRIRVDVFKEELSVNWLNKTFSDRLVSIADKIKKRAWFASNGRVKTSHWAYRASQ